MRTYLLDTCSFITAWRYYPPEMIGQLWEVLEQLAQEGSMFTVELVLDELGAKQDGIYAWVHKRSSFLVRALTEETQQACHAILERHPGMANAESIKPHADPFVIAEAKVSGATVVTQEHARGLNRIPAICKAEGVRCLDLFGFFAEVDIRFSALRGISQ